MRIVAREVANRVPRSTELRRLIATVIKQIGQSLESIENNVGEEWEDFDNARGLLREIPDQTDRLARIIGTLEDTIVEENKSE